MSLEEIQASLKNLSQEDLLSLNSAIAAELKKALKAKKEPKAEKKAPKKGSAPKGAVPPQLRKSFAWVDFVLQHALAHGWKAFPVKVKDEVMTLEGSVAQDDTYVFSDTKKPLNRKQAMSLSKHYWSPKEKHGVEHGLFLEFEKKFDESPALMMEVVEELDSTPTKSKSAKEPMAPKKARATKAKREEWSCPDDGCVHPWLYRGVEYARNFQNQVWKLQDGELGEWAGVWDGTALDETAPEPTED